MVAAAVQAFASQMLSRYVAGVKAAAEQDPVVGRAFAPVSAGIDQPPAMFSPSSLARVLSYATTSPCPSGE